MTMSYIPLFVSKHKHLLKEKLPLLVLFILLKIVFTNTQIPLPPHPHPHPHLTFKKKPQISLLIQKLAFINTLMV